MGEAVGEWERWQYGQWNDRLIDHYFRTDDRVLVEQPVDRLPATPEDLALAVHAPVAQADAVAEAFVRQIVAALPMGKVSFCGFCLDANGWTPRWPEPPHFFAMLWFTCLVAYGYPKGEGDFGDRIEQVLGKRDNFRTRDGGCLRGLWRAFAEWTKNRHDEGDMVRILELPPDDPQRPVIGISHFLAFPNRFDRRELARVLWQSGLVGFEPPIQPLLAAIEARRDHFSADFRDDLDQFVERFATGEDPRASAFWRAVRQEALDPSVDDSGARVDRNPTATLIFISTEDGLLPVVAVADGYRLPAGYEKRRFEDPGEWPFYVAWQDGDLETPWLAAFVDRQFLGIGLRMLVEQGLLVLREGASGQFTVATGADIHGCSSALVRTTHVGAFIAAFGGTAMPSIVCDWSEVTGCDVRQLAKTPAGLDGLTQLLPTMTPPSVTPVGGIRVSGGFLLVRSFLPLVRAAGATEVRIAKVGSESIEPCSRAADDGLDWVLPASVDAPGEYVLRATWNVSLPGGGMISRTGTSHLRFVEHVIDDRYKQKPSGGFFVESCPGSELDITNVDEVPFGITTTDPSCSADFLETESSARFLGPGHGEMSLVPKQGFDWLVIGSKKTPELLVFVGDPAAPNPPAQRRSSQSGDRRHWRSGFQAARVFIRDERGAYRPLDAGPAPVRDALASYRRHQVPDNAPECAETGLEAMTEMHLVRQQPSPRTQLAIDALAALSCRRSGLGYQQVREVFDELVGNDDPIVFQQILHGWAEAGIVDVLREAVVSRLTIVARRPHFVIVKRGPEVEATLVGMLSSIRRNRFEEALQGTRSALRSRMLEPGSPWQPATFRLRGPIEEIEALRSRSELEPSQWLDWSRIDRIPGCLDAGAALASLPRTEPASSYRRDAAWNWDLLSFQRGQDTPAHGIQLERRIHRDLSTIYVVLDGPESKAWTHSRSWALLVAYAMRREVPFVTDGLGLVWSQGRAPVHLPLPIGRLCALIGDGLPGPVFSGAPSGVLQHVYPFGRRLHALVERVLPSDWIEQPARKTNAGSNR